MPDYLNPFIPSGNDKGSYILKPTAVQVFVYVCMTFCPPQHKRLRELNICETKNCEIKVCELDLKKSKNCKKIVNEQIFIAFTHLFMDFI